MHPTNNLRITQEINHKKDPNAALNDNNTSFWWTNSQTNAPINGQKIIPTGPANNPNKVPTIHQVFHHLVPQNFFVPIIGSTKSAMIRKTLIPHRINKNCRENGLWRKICIKIKPPYHNNGQGIHGIIAPIKPIRFKRIAHTIAPISILFYKINPFPYREKEKKNNS